MSGRLSLIALAVLLGCRDEAKPAGSGSAASTRPSRHELGARPQLDTKRPAAELEAHEAVHAGPARDFDSEAEDPAWAKTMAAEIQTQVSGTQVRCKTRQCQVTIVAATAEEAIARTEQLRGLVRSDSDAPLAQWMPMLPASRADGTTEVLVYARFDR